ncbi:MAG: AIM24 family protein [Oscillospiraceae bacterium]|nr:AIM24 family protein [Oscillospiraceae bacterium]MBQ7119979.1 AIM24 family protein [Oscillospiraceae bacterium]
MAIRMNGWMSDNRKVVAEAGMFKVIEHQKDLSVSYPRATAAYFASQMNVKLRQVEINLDGTKGVKTQAGAMQMMLGNVSMETGIKGGAKGFLGSMVKAAVTNETAVKPEYSGVGQVILEPTYKHILLQDVASWGPGGLVIEDGMFLASEGGVEHSVKQISSSLSTALLSDEGVYNLCFTGSGIVALESYVPLEELVEIELENDTIKLDGSMAVCWSGSLELGVEKATKGLLGSLVSGEGFVNVYKGTGKIWVSPVAGTKESAPKQMSTGANETKETTGGGLLGAIFG